MGYIQLRTPHDVGLLLKDGRRRANLDQATLAQRLGVSRKWVVEAERGNAGAALGTILRALDIVGVQLAAPTRDGNIEASPRASSLRTPTTVDIDAIVDAARKRRR